MAFADFLLHRGRLSPATLAYQPAPSNRSVKTSLILLVYRSVDIYLSHIRLGCVDISSQPYESADEVEEAEVYASQLVETGEDAPVVLDLADEALNEVTLSV